MRRIEMSSTEPETPNNGHDTLPAAGLAAPHIIPPYDVTDDNSELALPVPRVNPKHIMRMLFKRADEPAITRLVDGIVRETQIQKRGTEVFRFNEDKAYAEHFDEIIEKVFAQEYLSDNPEVEIPAERIRRLNYELRAEAVRLLYQSEVTVDQGDGLNFLFEDEATLVATQTIGEPGKPPQFVIRHLVGRPGGDRRMRYRDDVSKLQTQREGKEAKRKVITDITFGIKLYREKFRGILPPTAEGGGVMISGHLYTDADQKEFLQYFNRLWMVEVADAVVASFQDAVGN
jgi:hypothetical protein